MVDLCLSSPLWTGILLCGLTWLKSPFHMAIDQWFMERYNAGKRRFMIITPRGHLKTSYFGTSFLTWRTLMDTEARILYMMASSKNAEKTLEAVTNVFSSSENLAHFFPDRKFDYTDPISWKMGM